MVPERFGGAIEFEAPLSQRCNRREHGRRNRRCYGREVRGCGGEGGWFGLGHRDRLGRSCSHRVRHLRMDDEVARSATYFRNVWKSAGPWTTSARPPTITSTGV